MSKCQGTSAPEPLLLQQKKVLDNVLRTGKDDDIGIFDVCGILGIRDFNVRFQLKRIEVGEVENIIQPHDGDLQSAFGKKTAFQSPFLNRQAVLDANTPPLSISPTRNTGAFACFAMAMLTMSTFARLISAGLSAT
jgi:hypothetical protein